MAKEQVNANDLVIVSAEYISVTHHPDLRLCWIVGYNEKTGTVVARHVVIWKSLGQISEIGSSTREARSETKLGGTSGYWELLDYDKHDNTGQNQRARCIFLKHSKTNVIRACEILFPMHEHSGPVISSWQLPK